MVSKEQVFNIVKSKLGTLIEYEIEVFDGAKHKGNVYGEFDWKNLWGVRVSNLDNQSLLEPTHLLLITKDSGEIIFNGYDNDEG